MRRRKQKPMGKKELKIKQTREADQLIRHIFTRLNRLTINQLMIELEEEYDLNDHYLSLMSLANHGSVEEYICSTLIPRYLKEGWLIVADEGWSIQRKKGSCQNCLAHMKTYYRIDQYGNEYCSSSCHETYMELARNMELDEDHPYEWDYQDSLALLASFQSQVEQMKRNFKIPLRKYNNPEMIDLLLLELESVHEKARAIREKIDYSFPQFKGYFLSEGDDGLFAREIYLHAKSMLQLDQEIANWCLEQMAFIWQNHFDLVMVVVSHHDFTSSDDWTKAKAIVSDKFLAMATSFGYERPESVDASSYRQQPDHHNIHSRLDYLYHQIQAWTGLRTPI